MFIHKINGMDQVYFIKVGILSSQQPENVMPAICHVYDASLFSKSELREVSVLCSGFCKCIFFINGSQYVV